MILKTSNNIVIPNILFLLVNALILRNAPIKYVLICNIHTKSDIKHLRNKLGRLNLLFCFYSVLFLSPFVGLN